MEQAEKHPAMEAQDAVKLCYQAAFGAEHLLRDKDVAYRYLEREYESVEADSGPLYEQIHETVCRVNLAAWKREGLPLEWLFRMFAETAANPPENGEQVFRDCLDTVGGLIRERIIGITAEQWDGFLSDYPVHQPQALHHSERYRNREHPAYRLVCSRFIRIFPILRAIAGMAQKPKIIALDGRAASGKTTLADQLARVTGAGVAHMDDFFLPPGLRTEERLAEPGGNVHYERFLEEVLPFLKSPRAFRYRCFDCSRMELGEVREIPEGNLRIVEGAYSCHPLFGDHVGLKVFCDVEPREQMRRIRRRNGAQMLERFRDSWIPMEERYFQHFQIREHANLTV
ncbi:MAG: hypothetical protein NC420_13945 [Eubacterium sp.]|nr:hypothetical protein [Eubacterium sp.]MCM1304643.1 hypothetical protein [Butyrivibrio sp.]MCM1344489.1 hypothetical protein [Muribaculaceae bacterium]MCM1412132.1 hypothetical protein [Lachnospiraceae bacterium]